MKNKKVINEVNRLKELMLLSESVAPGLLTVGRKMASTADDFIRKFIKTDLDNVSRAEVDAVSTRVRRGALQSLNDLADDELRILLKHIDYAKLAKHLFENGILLSRNSIDNNTQRIINSIINAPNPSEKYKEILLNLKNGASTDLWGTVPDMGDEFLPLADEFYALWLNQIKNTLKATDEKIFNEVSSSLVGKTLSKLSDNAKKFVDQWAFKNIQTLRRVLTRSLSSQENLAKEFITLGDEMASAIAAGQSPNYYTKKMADVLTAMNKSFKNDMESLLKMLKQDPNITSDIAREFERSDAWRDVLQTLSKNTNSRQALIDYVTAWKKLLWPFGKGKEGFLTWSSRLLNMILQQSPYTFEEMVQLLQKKGLNSVVANRIASGYFAKIIAVPLLIGTLKGLLSFPLEGFQRILGAIGVDLENPFGPSDEKDRETWYLALKDNYTDAFPKGIQWGIPFGTLVDEIWAALKAFNVIKAEDYIKQDQDDVETLRSALETAGIPQDLKDVMSDDKEKEIKIQIINGKPTYYWNSKDWPVEKSPDGVWQVGHLNTETNMMDWYDITPEM